MAKDAANRWTGMYAYVTLIYSLASVISHSPTAYCEFVIGTLFSVSICGYFQCFHM